MNLFDRVPFHLSLWYELHFDKHEPRMSILNWKVIGSLNSSARLTTLSLLIMIMLCSPYAFASIESLCKCDYRGKLSSIY